VSVASDIFESRQGTIDLRSEEEPVRLLVVEDPRGCAGLVRRTLGRASRGRFEPVFVERIEIALLELDRLPYDALLLDVGLPGTDEEATLDTAALLAHRLPVVVLTGTQSTIRASLTEADAAEDPRIERRFDRAELPRTILQAVRRHRRIGASGIDPVICRVPDC
jgi:DNA-binding NtrC family response regulator